MKPTQFSFTYFIVHFMHIDDSKELAKKIASALVAWFSYRVTPVELHPVEMFILFVIINFILSLIDAVQKTQGSQSHL